MVDNSLMLVLCYVDGSASVHISEKALDDFYKYCETPAGGNFRFGHLERSISRFLGFDIQRDAKGFIPHPHPRFAGDGGSIPHPHPRFARIGDQAEYH